MQINWPLITVLFCLSLPGIFIAIPRLINMLLPFNREALRKRASLIVISQIMVMILMMSFAGSVLSVITGFSASLLDSLLQGQAISKRVLAMLLPVSLYTLAGLLVFLGLYYGLVTRLLDPATLAKMKKLRATLGPDGCILYAGVVEEVLVRWGLMNLIAFFAVLYAGQQNITVIWLSILLSGLLSSLGQLPVYFAAGCQPSRRFIYSTLLLNLWQAILFGWLFWQYDLVAAILSHMFFHLGWTLYERP